MENHTAKIISFINMKGGVAKTTLTINIGKQLADIGNKVLVIDMDPQFNATQSLLLYKTRYYQATNNSNQEEVVKEEIKSSEFYNKLSQDRKTTLQMFESSNIAEPNKNESLVQEICSNLYLIPGDLTMAKEISGDTSNKVGAVWNHLKKNNIFNDYQYVLIDCPPTWSILTHSSLFASDYYIIPSKVDLYSSIGIKLLENQIKEKILQDSVYQMTEKQLKRLGVIFTLVHKNVKGERDQKDSLKRQFDDVDFFDNDLPYMPSVPTRFIMIDEAKKDPKYSELINSIEKITAEIIDKLHV